MLGHSVYSENWKTEAGINFRSFNLKNINAGIYFTKVSSLKAQKVFKTIITK